MNKVRRSHFYIVFGLAFILILSLIWYVKRLPQRKASVLTWEECTSFPDSLIQESYPERCMATDGRSVTRPLTPQEQENLKPPSALPTTDYFGNSTRASCDIDSDCLISGCNSEICQGKGEEDSVSICILPDKPLPKDVGLSCGCFENSCMWGDEIGRL